MDISIIIVNWNTKDLLERCLNCVTATAGAVSYELIVVDNASIDGSTDMLRAQYPQVRLVENSQNIGFARANNQGLAIARGRYYLLLNSDAFVNPGAIPAMVKFMDRQADAGACGCRLYYEDGGLQRSAYSFTTLWTELWQTLWLDRLFPRSKIFGKYHLTYWNMDDTRQVDSIMGAVMLLRAEAICQVGTLDDRYFMYSEEMDLCYRLKKAGWKVYYFPEASAIHIWGGSSQKVQTETTFLRLYHSRVRYFRKHYSRLTTWLYKLLLAFGSLVRTAGGSLAYLFTRRQETRLSTRNYWMLVKSVWTY